MSSLSQVNLTAATDEALFGLGDEVTINGAVWKYVRANGSIAVGQICGIEADLDATPFTTAISGARPSACCIPQIAATDNQFLWAPVGPFFLREDNVTPFRVLALTLCAADVKLYTTVTAGAVDDTATDLIQGLVLTATNSSGSTALTACQAMQRLVSNCQD